ncbi:MAG: glycosyltransferase [Rhodobacteraceae bacterium]|nr:glycosyltransferase [Paracoccaceae bacterium]
MPAVDSDVSDTEQNTSGAAPLSTQLMQDDSRTRTDFLHYVVPTFNTGGAQRRFVAIMNGLSPKYRCSITALDAQYGAAEGFAQHVTWERFNVDGPGENIWVRRRVIRRALSSKCPDLLVTNNWGAIEWAAANRPRIVRHIHIEDGFGPEEAQRQLPRRVWFRRFALGGPSTLVVPSRTLLKIAREIWRIPERKIRYVPNGIPCTKFDRQADPSLFGRLRGEGPVIGTLAALRPEKALHRLIDAFAEVRAARTCRLAIIGEGGQRAELEAQAAKLGLENDITFVGHLSHPELILGGLAVFALSSDTEQMPLTVLEAMAAGVPVASVDVGDVAGMVSPDNAPFIVSKSAQALAGAIAALLDAPERARAIGRANQAHARREYDESTMFAAYDGLFSGRQ